MKKTVSRLGLVAALAVILIMASGSLAAQPVAAGTARIPIENYFISCELVSLDRMWVEDGVRHIRGRNLAGIVISNEDYHAGPATNMVNMNIVLASGHVTSFGKLEMHPVAYPDGGWEGSFTSQGLPGDQTGVARLKGYGSLKGYYTKTVITHLSGPALFQMFGDVCGTGKILGGSHAVGYVLLPGGE
jgi:hypothetical protein